MVLAVQTVIQFQAIGRPAAMGSVVNLSVLRELGPVLAGVMLAGRVGGGLTAELGTMRVTEQIDALRAMGADPHRVLVVPRFLACVLLDPGAGVLRRFHGHTGRLHHQRVHLLGQFGRVLERRGGVGRVLRHLLWPDQERVLRRGDSA